MAQHRLRNSWLTTDQVRRLADAPALRPHLVGDPVAQHQAQISTAALALSLLNFALVLTVISPW